MSHAPRSWWWWWWCGGAAVVTTVVLSLAYVTARVHSLVAVEQADRQQARTNELARSALWRIDSDLMGRLSTLQAKLGDQTFEHRTLTQDDLESVHQAADGLPLLTLWVHARPDTIRLAGTEDSEKLTAQLSHLASEPWTTVGTEPGNTMHATSNQTARPASHLPLGQGDFDQRNVQMGNSLAANQWNRSPTTEATPSLLRPVQIAGTQLLLVRALGHQQASRMYDVLELDWPRLRQRLCLTIQDLLPHATLTLSDQAATAAYPLAALPIILIPGPLDHPASTMAPVMLALAAAWLAVLVAVVAVVVTLLAVLAMAERKAAFAAAVTHELRTPITSLRLYADMLGEGMITDPLRQQEYLRTIRAESERLGTLIENVLSFARLERQRAPPQMQLMPARELISSCQERLQRRATQSGMVLEVILPAAGDAEVPDAVRADPVLVEQVLSNLVDNACKYASGGPDRRIVLALAVDAATQEVRILVRDFGPGVADDILPRLFVPFSRSRATSATAQGVGLGLALSRRIATYLQARLEYRPMDPGALFLLSFPARPHAR